MDGGVRSSTSSTFSDKPADTPAGRVERSVTAPPSLVGGRRCRLVAVAGTIPLSTLLSHVLVAFTIEVDNAFEEQMPHRTAMGRRSGEAAVGPWLVSLAKWSTFMQFVPVEGITVGEQYRAFGDSDLRGRNPGMVRWGYVTLGPGPGDSRPKQPRSDWLVRPTEAGRRAQEIWRPLPSAVERRWTDRYGRPTMAALRRSLRSLVEQVEVELPDYLPTNGGHSGRVDVAFRPAAARVSDSVDLSAMLAKALLAFTLDFERESPLPLVMSANPLRAIGTEPMAVRDLPGVTGVAKETLAVMLGALVRRGYVAVNQNGRMKTAGLTALGQAAQRHYHQGVKTIEERWCSRYGSATVTELRAALENLVGDTMLARSPLAAAIEPPAGGWRAKVARPQVLPHHPVVSHRGGYADGS